MSLLGEWGQLFEKALGEGYYVHHDLNPETCSSDMDFIVGTADIGEISRAEPVGPPQEGTGAETMGVFLVAPWASTIDHLGRAGVYSYEAAAAIIHNRAHRRREWLKMHDARRRLGGF